MYDIISYVMLDSSNAGQGSLFNLNLSVPCFNYYLDTLQLIPQRPISIINV